MDSKFGPDGALYVQTYDGFFRAGTDDRHLPLRLRRRRADPGRRTRGRSRSARCGVRFSSAGSGGVAWEWDFGDGSAKVDRANPTHTYAEAKRYTATLTVTYADGAKDTKTVDVDVLAAEDKTAPVTTRDAHPGHAGRGGNVYTSSRHRDADRDGRGAGQWRRHDGVPRQRRRLDARTTAPDPPRAAGHVRGRVPLDRPHRQRRGRSSRSRSRSRSRRTARRTSTTSSTAPELDPKWTGPAR